MKMLIKEDVIEIGFHTIIINQCMKNMDWILT